MYPDNPTDSDDSLLGWQAGDPVVFGRLVRRFQRPVFGFLGRMGFSQADTEELAQETFLRAWRARESYDLSRGQVSTWLFTIARNLAHDEAARRHREPVQSDLPDAVADSNPARDPVAQFQTRQRIGELRNALRQLSVEDRSAIALHYVQELSARDAAIVLGCTAGTFRTRLSRAKARLVNQMTAGEVR